MNMQPKSTNLSLPFPSSYLLEEVPHSKQGLLLLHGFADRADAVRKRFLGLAPMKDFWVLAPNAGFPFPVKTSEGYKEAYSWYFRDLQTGKEMISPEFAALYVDTLIRALGLDKIIWTPLGFSQGGYLIPFLRKQGIKFSSAICAGCGFENKDFQSVPPFKIYAVHGEKDQVISPTQAKKEFDSLAQLNPQFPTEFQIISGLNHSLNDDARKQISQWLEKLKLN